KRISAGGRSSPQGGDRLSRPSFHAAISSVCGGNQTMALMVGDDGKVFCGSTPLADITSWRFETSAAGISYASSSTDGYRRQIVGARQGKGKICFRVDAAAPVWGVLSDGSQV